MLKILVIGNGFDKAHGLLTGYGDFLDWFRYIIEFNNRASENPDQITEHLDIQINYPEEYKKIIDAEGNFWISYFIAKRDQIGEKWLDFESGIESLAKKIYSDIKTVGLNAEITNLNKEYPMIIFKQDIKNKEGLFEWLFDELHNMTQLLEIYLCIASNKKISDSARMQLFNNINADKLLSFNYTPTYHKVYRSDIETDYIHGEAQMKHPVEDECNLVLGFDDHYLEKTDNIPELIPFEKYYQRIIYRCSNDYFKWMKKKGKKEIHFYGHSLSPADGDISKLLIEGKNTKTIIYYREGYEQERADIIKNLARILTPNGLIERMGGINPTVELVPVPETKPDLRKNAALENDLLGIESESKGNIPKAKEYYERAYEIYDQLAKESNIVGARRDISLMYNKLGDICKAEGNLTEAREYYKKSLCIFEQLASKNSTAEAHRDISLGYSKLGDICMAEENLPDARKYYEKGLEIREQSVAEKSTAGARRDLSLMYNKLGDVCKAERKLTEAEEYYEKCLKIREQLVAEKSTVGARRDLSLSYNKLGDICKAEGNLPDARKYYEKGLEISELLAAEKSTVGARRDLSISYKKLGDICNAEENLPEARKYYEKSLEISEQLAAETGTVRARHDLSVSFNKLGDICKSQGNIPEAMEYYLKCAFLVQKENLKDISVGKTIKFGLYKQDDDDKKFNGKEEIEWKVLAIEGTKALIISEYALDFQPYNISYTNATWEKSTLRTWLNETFYNSAFGSGHQAMIESSNVLADKNPACDTDPGNATTDKVFLLSIAEAEKYFSPDSARQCKATDYVKTQTKYIYGSGNCRWWLRSPGINHYNAACVRHDGSIYYDGCDVLSDDYCVRPALWINPES